MKKIEFDYNFIYYDAGNEIIRKVPCTKNESIESAKSILKELRADKVIKIKR